MSEKMENEELTQNIQSGLQEDTADNQSIIDLDDNIFESNGTIDVYEVEEIEAADEDTVGEEAVIEDTINENTDEKVDGSEKNDDGADEASNGDNNKKNFINKIKLPIRFKLIGAFLIPVVLIVILGVMSYSTASKAIENSYKESSQSAINKTAEYYQFLMENIKSIAVDFGNDTSVKQYYSGSLANDVLNEKTKYDEFSNSLSSKVLSNSAVKCISVFGSYGKSVYTNNIGLKDEGEYINVKAAMEGQLLDKNRQGWFTSREYIDKTGGNDYAFSYAKTIMNNATKNVGYIFVDVDKDYVLATLKDIDMGKNSLVALVAPDGGELVVPDNGEAEAGKQYIVDNDFYKEALEAEETRGSKYVKYNGKKTLFIYNVTEEGFMVCALIPNSTILSQASAIFMVTVVVVIFAMIVAVIIGGYLSGSISKSIKNIMGKLELAAAGDLTINVAVKSNDEFAVLAGSTNDMIGNVKLLIEKTKNISDKVDDSVDRVTESAKQLLLESKEITLSIQEIENGVVQQAQDSEDCLRQMDSLSDKINVVSENSGKIAKIAEETSSIVDNGRGSLTELQKHADGTVDITHQVIDEIVKLKDSSRAIESIISVINEIAEQTNLLSLNASIEAARAGEAGKGFSVVADEIRKLADQSVDSVNEIRKIVNDINEKTNDTVSIARRAEDIVANQVNALEDVERVFGEIQTRFGELVSNLDEIAGGIDIIAEAKALTIDAISSISAVSEQTAAASEEVTETANRQLELVEHLNSAAEALNNNSNDLTDAIDLFKI